MRRGGGMMVPLCAGAAQISRQKTKKKEKYVLCLVTQATFIDDYFATFDLDLQGTGASP